ncbi:unnamed protein product [Prorocentrum cordatum]|uniref:Uncharacterized protein n=1 Tax=Prorocentrum cordatum TaxID=2364126 RepID=A0ABN9W5C9_9DINO|nr:unnamed protein product [Polarella glacialis]
MSERVLQFLDSPTVAVGMSTTGATTGHDVQGPVQVGDEELLNVVVLWPLVGATRSPPSSPVWCAAGVQKDRAGAPCLVDFPWNAPCPRMPKYWGSLLSPTLMNAGADSKLVFMMISVCGGCWSLWSAPNGDFGPVGVDIHAMRRRSSTSYAEWPKFGV